MLLLGELQIDAMNLNFKNFKHTLYMKSVSCSALNKQIFLTFPPKCRQRWTWSNMPQIPTHLNSQHIQGVCLNTGYSAVCLLGKHRGGGDLVERWVRGCAAHIGCFFGRSGLSMAPFLFEKWFRYRSRFCKMLNFRFIFPLVYL